MRPRAHRFVLRTLRWVVAAMVLALVAPPAVAHVAERARVVLVAERDAEERAPAPSRARPRARAPLAPARAVARPSAACDAPRAPNTPLYLRDCALLR